MVESAGIPNPGGTDGVILLVTIVRPQEAALCAALATIGSLIGSFFFYALLRKGGEKFLANRTASGRGAQFRSWFQRYGLLTVFISALVPIPILPLKAFIACAGAMGVSRTRFLLVMLAARVPRYAALAYLGAKLGEDSLGWAGRHKWYLVGGATVLFAAMYALIRWQDRRRTTNTLSSAAL